MNAAGPVLLQHEQPRLFGLQIDQFARAVHALRIGYDVQKIKAPKILEVDGTAMNAPIV
jgi:hypothetical protein